ncbi:Ptr3p [Sugiyamaella lignohabitans]|uniref:Ptr3p n=1 Tax=Sugiyamaella lignohabitans TaxID=796027 RepID=A0A161HK37_9ASCO|nr:Ptr3p [Sugiyamaella lignohabitans]ANB11928.1 Ptr3p [Sugiyamaella lignohabitans]
MLASVSTSANYSVLKGKERINPAASNKNTVTSWSDFLYSLEKLVTHPEYVVLSCGCVLPEDDDGLQGFPWKSKSDSSQRNATRTDSNLNTICPICATPDVQILNRVPILHDIYQVIANNKRALGLGSSSASSPNNASNRRSSSTTTTQSLPQKAYTETNNSNVEIASSSPSQKRGLIELLREAARTAAANEVGIIPGKDNLIAKPVTADSNVTTSIGGFGPTSSTLTTTNGSSNMSTSATAGDSIKFDVGEWMSNIASDQQSQHTQLSEVSDLSQRSQLSQLSQPSQTSHQSQTSQLSQASKLSQTSFHSQSPQPGSQPTTMPPPSQPTSIPAPQQSQANLSRSPNFSSTSPLSQQQILHNHQKLMPSQPLFSQAELELREFNFSKSFPIYRKQFVHPTQPRNFLRSNKNSLASAISPDISHIMFASKGKCLFYTLPQDFNDPPILQHTLILENSDSSDSASIRSNKTSSSSQVTDWDKPMVSMTNNLAVVASQSGILKVIRLEPGYSEVYSYQSSFGIHCMTISPRGDLIAYAIVGRDKISGGSQPMIVLHRLGRSSLSSSHSSYLSNADSISWNEDNVNIVTLTIPYRDPIATLSFSSDACYLSCSTCTESRFMVISVMNPQEPRLVMKSSRRADVGPEYEGITSVRFFPSNSRYLAVTSVASSAPPIILDSKVSTSTRSMSSGASSGLSHPSVMMRVDKVGSSIHKAEISPRGDAVAFLDKNGLVSVMYSKGMVSELKRITIVDEVATAQTLKEAAAMQFSPNGHVLVIADRKGNVHIEDFGAALPHQAGMGKCRILS